jgi:hypothetical protein
MNTKKIVSVLFLSSAFTKRNVSSVGLVALFLLVYVLAGGKIDTKLPTVSQSGAFGSVGGRDLDNVIAQPKANSKEVLGIVPTENRALREDASQTRGRVFTNEEAEESARQPIDKSGLIVGQKRVFETDRERVKVEKSEQYRRESVDPFAAIEERLNKKP